MSASQEKLTGIIAWFARNPVAANLLMIGIIIGGLFSYSTINKKMFPEFNPNSITVSVPHLGAAPEEVEKSVILKVEEALENIEGIKRMTSYAFEGNGQVNLELESGYSLSEMLDEVQMQIDAITTFPAQTEKPIVTKVEFQGDVLWVSVYGSMDRKTRQELAKQVRDEIMTLPEVNIAQIVGNRDYEISIEISEFKLKKYGLTFDEVSRAVRNSSIDLPGGSIKAEGGDILLRTKGQAYTGEEYSNLVLRTNSDGTRLLLGDVANVIDGFVEGEGFARFDGEPTSSIRIKSTGDQNDLAIAAAVKEYVDEKQDALPEGAKLGVWGDSSYYLNARLDMMLSNMVVGAFLVFCILAMFLRVRIAFWVMVGIPVCFFGAFIVMPNLGEWSVSINLLSLFAFIMVLGIVVDDAIVIGESIYTEIREYGHTTDNVIRGAHRVAMPATFGVLTTIAAFTPLLMIEANFAAFFRAIAIVVSACLVFSLIESKWILPAHLAHMKYSPIDKANANFFEKFQASFRNWLENFIEFKYKPLLEKAVKGRYNTMAIFIATWFVALGLIMASLVKVEVFPNIPSDFIQGNITMVDGSSVSARNEALNRIEQAALEMGEEHPQANGESFIHHTMLFTNGDTGGGFLLELTKPEERDLGAFEIEKLWREKVGEIPGAKELRFFAGTNAGGGAALEFQLVGANDEELDAAARTLELQLGEYDGVFDIRNSFSSGSQEIQLKIKPEAEVLGLTLNDLGRQVRQAFYGEEAQRIQRGRDELKVMVRYPESERRSIADLENMWIRTPAGQEVPFYQVADVEIGTGFTSITRVNQKRSITVSADIDPAKVESRKVIEEVNTKTIPDILSQYPSVKYGIEGASKDQQDFLKQLAVAFIGALGMIYCLIAIPTKSYSQPVIIMMVIPFGVIGAIVGHFLLGKSLNMLSLYGIIALTGVVVNDSLIMVDFINKARAQGIRMIDAVVQSGTKRFRAVLLTSLTTFFGVLPIYFETSLQAQFIIPMAISIGFGIMFATVITLFLIPCLYMILEDIKNLFRSRKSKTAYSH
ncbi:efflux RND transporter permease subunit [Aliikangiella coralliicola]|uniref:Efflux RND transporter permease subunit n=1 Tax=Aliikangiella coralliicola TaxID=2592383 RepID=A0A545UDX2_9GAMM|nr:efflux RND transporter permease subunit [Aliikangiella coralliicola]TQV87675.1 efflux RND transporter permease subunit [Aliikangiella coralliicola]